MIKLFWPGLLAVLLLSGCGWNGTPTRHNDFVPLTSIEITAVSSTIAANTTTKLSVIGHYSGLFTRDITDQATWVSGSPTVVDFTVGVPGRVKGLTAGTSILTATVAGVPSATYTLTVSNATITSMTIFTVPPTIPPATPTVPSGLTKQFAVTGSFSDGTTVTTQDLTFDATWAADASGFASVSDVLASKGLAKGLAVGTATITATFGGIPGTTQLIVTAPILQSIAVSPANFSIAGFQKTVNYTALGTYSDGTTAAVSEPVTWASSQTGIATIATTGVATTAGAGTTSISATVGSISGKTDLTVTALILNLTPASQTLTVVVGSSHTGQFTLTATPSGGAPQDVTAISAWISNAPAVATVGSNTGLVTGVAVGTTTITATYSGQTATATVTVQ
jgi:uncharacterized protein YjdB